MSQQSGVYEIVNVINGNRYIGSSIRIASRLSAHKCQLRQNKSHNQHLQSAYNKYGEESFVFRPLLYCDPENTLLYEQMCIDGMQTNYNKTKNAESPFTGCKLSKEQKEQIGLRSLGNKYSLGRKNSPETIARMSAARKGKPGPRLGCKLSDETKEKIRAGNLGRKHTPEELAKMSAAMKLPRSDKYKISHSGDKNSQAKLTWSQVNEIREFYDKTDVTKASLARKYNVTNRTIFLIVNNLSWKVNQQ
jgi:group I intron endonuclease